MAEKGAEFATPNIVRKFDEVFKRQMESDPYGKDSKLQYRALKETLRDKRFYEEEYTNEDIRTLSNHLLDQKEYSSIFKEWLTTRQLEWGLKTFPRNIYRLFAVAKKEVERRKTTY